MNGTPSAVVTLTLPRILSVTVTDDTLSVDLEDGRTLAVPIGWYPRLAHASASQRANWQICGGGYGVHWPEIDEDLSTEGLLRGAPAPRRGCITRCCTRSSRCLACGAFCSITT